MIITGNSLEELKKIESNTIQCCITSPPYFHLRDYGVDGQIGLEDTLYDYIENLKNVFCEVRRILKEDGTLWLNLGDTYSGGNSLRPKGRAGFDKRTDRSEIINNSVVGDNLRLPSKNLLGVPWRVAFALQDSGWILRQDIIWRKPNPMPSPVNDRCTTAHEYVFLFAKNTKYFFNSDAIKEPVSESYAKDKRPVGVLRQRLYTNSKYAKDGMYNIDIESTYRRGINSERGKGFVEKRNLPAKAAFLEYIRSNHTIADLVAKTGLLGTHIEHWFRKDECFAYPSAEDWKKVNVDKFPEISEVFLETDEVGKNSNGYRNKHSVWDITVKPFRDAHFAVMPIELVNLCILAGSRERDTILDPFFGAGTVGLGAIQNNRSYVGIEINPEYVELAKKRIEKEQPCLL